jgi:hypothetical protein
MPTENRSPSYLQEREAVRKWLLQTKEGHWATELAKREAPQQNLAPFFDDDKWLGWGDIYREYKDALVVAANCAEARETARLQMKSRNRMGIPAHGPSRMMRFFSPPMSLLLRRQVELQDPDYWNDMRNVLKEALNYPEYCCVPLSLIRSELESLQPKGNRTVIRKEGLVESGR